MLTFSNLFFHLQFYFILIKNEHIYWQLELQNQIPKQSKTQKQKF